MRLKFNTKLFTEMSFSVNEDKKNFLVDDVMSSLKKCEKILFINCFGVHKLLNLCISILTNRVKAKENNLTLDNNCKLVIIRYDVCVKIDKSRYLARPTLIIEVKCIYQNFNKRKPRNKKISYSLKEVI